MTRRWYSLVLLQCVASLTLRAQHTLVLTGGTIVPVDALTAPFKGTIVIQGDTITAVLSGPDVRIPEGGEVIDITGKFVIPGLIDAHAHVTSHSQRAALVTWGVTTILNPNESLESMAARRAGTIPDAPVARVLSTGPIIGPLDMQPFGVRGVSSPADARRAVREMQGAGVDAIKVFYDDLGYVIPPVSVITVDAMRALIDESHRLGLRAMAHAATLPRAREVLEAGADLLLHSVISDPVDDEFIQLMLQRRAMYVPTLAAFEAQADIAAWGKRLLSLGPDSAMRAASDSLQRPATVALARRRAPNAYVLGDRLPVMRDNLRRLSSAGVPIVMGTDTGIDGVLPGISSVMELVLAVEAGLTPRAALQSATINAARALGMEESLGTIAPGKRADLVVLDSNPLGNIQALARVHVVVIGGRVVRH